MHLVLATSSHFRRKIFNDNLAREFQSHDFLSPDIDEKALRHPDPEELCRIIASAKCDAVLNMYSDTLPANSVIVTCDQVVLCNGEMREKPEDADEARQFMRSYAAGHPAKCLNGIVVHNVASGMREVRLDTSTVYFSPYPESLIDKMIEQGDVFKSAGAFIVDDHEMGKYVQRIQGHVTSIEGLPIQTVKDMIQAVSGHRFAAASSSPLASVTHLLFDMDGLLLDTESMYTIVQQKLLDPYGLTFTPEVKSKMMGRRAVDAAQVMVEHYGLQGKMDPEKFVRDREALLDELFAECDLMPGVERLLMHFHTCKVPMAIATSSHKRHFDLKTRRHRDLFDKVFHHVVTGDDVDRSKPEPDIFIKAAERFPGKVDPANVLVFEDAILGVEAANRAGMRVVWVPTVYGDENILLKADQTLTTLVLSFIMTICRYWQQGDCQYGNSCRFEHTARTPASIFGGPSTASGGQQPDITNTLVTTVKQDLEQSEKGHQWLFSCYSPAKDCASLPGIDDISPEEIRFEAYTAKLNGTAPQFQQKYQQLIQSYNAKRQSLLNPTPELKETLRRIYNKESLTGGGAFTSPVKSGSIFGGGTSAAAPSTSFGGSPANNSQAKSIFGGSTFGSSASTPSASNVFGSSPSAPQSSSLFGAQQQTSLFGGGSQPPTSSIFGGTAAASQPKPAFGGTTAFGQKPTFGQTPNPPQQQQQGIFGGASSIFGQAVSSAPNTGSAWQQPTTTTSVFGGTQQQQQQQQQPASVFGGAQSSVFGTAAAPQTSSGGPGLFGEQASTQTSVFGGALPSTTSNVFQQQQQQQQPSGTSVFGSQPASSSNTGVFGAQPSSSVFVSPQQQPQQINQTLDTTAASSIQQNIFGGPEKPGAFANVFGSPTSAETAGGGATAGTNPFGKSTTGSVNAGLFGKVVEPQKDTSVYTPLDKLTPEELESFKADNFVLGKIPEKPPPKELCCSG